MACSCCTKASPRRRACARTQKQAYEPIASLGELWGQFRPFPCNPSQSNYRTHLKLERAAGCYVLLRASVSRQSSLTSWAPRDLERHSVRHMLRHTLYRRAESASDQVAAREIHKVKADVAVEPVALQIATCPCVISPPCTPLTTPAWRRNGGRDVRCGSACDRLAADIETRKINT